MHHMMSYAFISQCPSSKDSSNQKLDRNNAEDLPNKVDALFTHNSTFLRLVRIFVPSLRVIPTIVSIVIRVHLLMKILFLNYIKSIKFNI